jgi:hypothetical protein
MSDAGSRGIGNTLMASQFIRKEQPMFIIDIMPAVWADTSRRNPGNSYLQHKQSMDHSANSRDMSIHPYDEVVIV